MGEVCLACPRTQVVVIVIITIIILIPIFVGLIDHVITVVL